MSEVTLCCIGWLGLAWQYHPKFAFYANPLPIFEGKSDSPHFIHDPNSNRVASPCWLLVAKLCIASFLNTGLVFWPPKWVVKYYSLIIADGKTFVLVFCVLQIDSTHLFTRLKMNSTLVEIVYFFFRPCYYISTHLVFLKWQLCLTNFVRLR